MRVIRWAGLALGLSALLLATRIVFTHLVGVVVFFVTAFQARVNDLDGLLGESTTDVGKAKPALPRLRANQAYRDSLRVEPVLGAHDEIHLDPVRENTELNLR